MPFETDVANPTEFGYEDAPEGSVIRSLPITWLYGEDKHTDPLILSFPPIDGGLGYLPSLEAELDALNAGPSQDKDSGELLERLFQIHQCIQATSPDALVFPIFNGVEWVSLPTAISAIQHVMSCPHRNGGCCCGGGCH